MTAPLRVLLAEDHTLVRKGIRAVLRQVSWIEVIAEAAASTASRRPPASPKSLPARAC